MSSFNYKGSLTMKKNRCEAFGSIHNTNQFHYFSTCFPFTALPAILYLCFVCLLCLLCLLLFTFLKMWVIPNENYIAYIIKHEDVHFTVVQFHTYLRSLAGTHGC